MTCEATQRQLLELPGWRFVELDHLASCASCRAKADAIRAGQEALRTDLDTFAAGGDLRAVLVRAKAPRPARWSGVALWVAAALVLWVAARGILGQPVLPGTGGPTPAPEPIEQGDPMLPERSETAPAPRGAEVREVPPFADPQPVGEAPVSEPREAAPVAPASPAALLGDARRAYGEHRYASAELLAGEALGAADRWPAATRLQEQNSAWQIRALASYQQWVSAEQTRMGEQDDPTLFARSESSRTRAAETARDWLRFCDRNGLARDQAFDLCKSASGTFSSCD
ncbi:MAG: hypothetical protein H6737_30520 [Alphaproteobacteria bacterium]|nr:hypothetical protein [Alphaproteobacteria bacterium]